MTSYIRQPLRGIPIRYKKIKGKLYAYQRIDAYRDKATGKVHVTDRHLGAVIDARQKPIMDSLNAKDQERIIEAWRGGEDIDMIIERVKVYTGEPLTSDPVYKWFRKRGITRGPRTTKRATKRVAAAEAQVDRIRRIKREEKEIKARQAKRRAQARKEMERR